MQHNVRKYLGLWMMIPAALFLIDPNIAFRDFLPNCIGYLLLLAGLSQLRDLSDQIDDACRGLKKMLWVSVGLLAAQIYIQYILPAGSESMNEYENPTLLLLCSFVSLILQCYFLLPAYRELFLGVEALAERYGDEQLICRRRGKGAGERLWGVTRFFIIASAIASLLPEASVLTSFEYEVEQSSVDFFQFIWLFRTVATFLSAVFALIWLIPYLRFWIRLLRHEGFCRAIEARYREEILPQTELLDLRRVRLAYSVLTVGAVFSINLRADGRELLPTFLIPVVCFIGIWLARHSFGIKSILLPVTGGLLFLCGIAQAVGRWTFIDRYDDMEAAFYFSEAYVRFLMLAAVQAVVSVLMLAFFACLLAFLYRSWKGKLTVTYSGTDAAEASLHSTQKLRHRYAVRTGITVAFFAVSTAGQIADAFLCIYAPWLWWVTLALSVASVCALSSLLQAVAEELSAQIPARPMYKMQEDAHTDFVISNDKTEEMQNEEQPESEQPESEQPKQSEPVSEQSEPEQSEPEQSEQESEQPKQPE